MIADLDETIRQLLTAELPILEDEIDIKFDQPKREWSSRLSKPTINLFMYDMRENVRLRAQQWERQSTINGRRANVIAKKRSPVRIDCQYMLSCWAVEPEDEHNLMSAATMCLLRFPTIPSEYLVGMLTMQPYQIMGKLAAPETLPNVAEVWGVLDNEMRPTLPYTITLAFDPWTTETAPMVRNLRFRTQQWSSDSGFETLHPADEGHVIAGTVYDDETLEPLPDVEVALRGTGYVAKTNIDGQFRLGGMRAGAYELVAWKKIGRPVQRQISIPSDDVEDGYDIFM